MSKIKIIKDNDLNIKDSNINIEKDGSKFRNRIMGLLQKFGRGLMLPISVLPFAGILLGIGGTINSNIHTEIGQTIGGIFQGMSNVIFANLPLFFCIAITITFTGEAGAAAFMAIMSYLVFTSSQSIFIHYSGENNDIFKDIFWFHNQDGVKNIVAMTLGMRSLSTSLFGGIIVSVIVIKIYNKFKYIQLPNAISFFSGIRFLPFILIPASFLLAICFLIFWPWIGLGINFIGEKISLTPVGVDGFIYGIMGRALMPFGLHTILITIAYQSPFGGALSLESIMNLTIDESIKNILSSSFNNFAKGDQYIYGDQNIWNYINTIPLNQINGTPIFKWFKSEMGINAGRFMQDYPIYQGACMGIGAALIFTASKENRKAAISVIGSAMIVAFLTGITEPLEYTFLFVAPLLYYAIYVPLSGLAYLLMEMVNAHVGVGFARGFIDLMIYGAVPVSKGTNFYWSFLFDIIFGCITFVSFYFYIKWKDIPTPGRKGNEIILFTKKNMNEKNNLNKNDLSLQNDKRMLELLNGLGGIENIISVTACATRLRLSLKNSSIIKQDDMKKLGASGTIIKGLNVQIIFGGEAVILSEKINDYIKSKL